MTLPVKGGKPIRRFKGANSTNRRSPTSRNFHSAIDATRFLREPGRASSEKNQALPKDTSDDVRFSIERSIKLPIETPRSRLAPASTPSKILPSLSHSPPLLRNKLIDFIYGAQTRARAVPCSHV